LDDCLLHTKTEDDLLATLNFFFKQCREHGLKLHASKCVLVATRVRYCGRLITKNGVSFDPNNMEALQTMHEPQNGADLVQYVAAVNWMRSAIPNYSKRVAPLQAALSKVFGGKSRRTKKGAAGVSLLQLWGPEEKVAFKDLQAAIMDSVTFAFPDPDKRICVLTDASDCFYAGLVTQIVEEQLDLPMEEQDPQPLAFLSGEFKGAQLRWIVPEKEGFAIVDTVSKVDYLLLTHDELSILSDHLNVTYIYNPLSADPTPARHLVHKLQLWELKMSVFSYHTERVMGEFNYWTDLMTRRRVGWVAGSENKAHGKMAILFAQPYIRPPDYDLVEFPSKKDILLVQHIAVDEYECCQQGSAMARQEVPPQQFDSGGMRMMNNALWIPECAVELQLRLCVEAHCRSAGHRAYEATLGAIKEYVAWTTVMRC
jgi:RNase H-like domain found in reverse transcriptase